MKTSLYCIGCIAFGLLLSPAVVAANNVPGPVPAPTLLSAAYVDDDLCLEWTDVPEAIKYSVELFGLATYLYDDPNTLNDPNIIEGQVRVELSFGTSDRVDGGAMGDPNLCIPVGDICDEVIAIIDAELELMGIDPNALNSFILGNDNGIEDPNDLYAQVKSLTPGKGNGAGSGGPNNPFFGRQNNLFSDPLWIDPLECILVE
jgi:hypothetical protein